MYEHNCCYILFLHFISATVLHKKHFTQPTKLLQFYDWNHVHIKYLYLMSCVLLNTRLTQGPNITRPSQSQPYCCRGSLLSESPLFYFPSYTEQNFWVTICKIPCTSTDHICEPKFIIKKKNSLNPFSRKYGATKIEVYAKVLNAPGITSVEQKFPNRKLFQSYMHPLFSPILLLMIQALALAHNFWIANKTQLQEVNNHYNKSWWWLWLWWWWKWA